MESNTKKTRNRKAPPLWRDVFDLLHRNKTSGFHTQDVRRAIRDKGLRISDLSLQVKLAKYVSKNYLFKNGRDQFHISSSGIDFFSLKQSYDGSEEDYMNQQ